MKLFFISLATFCIFGSSTILSAQTKPIENLRDYLESAIASGQKEISVPKGVYKVPNFKSGGHLVFSDLDGVKINFNGSDLICGETSCAILATNCKNFTIENLNVDYDPLPFTQGKIVAMSDDKSVHEVEIFEGYADTSKITSRKYEVFDAKTRRLKADTYNIEKIEPISPTRFKAYKAQWNKTRNFQNEEIGDIVVTENVSLNGRGGHAIFLNKCENTTLKNINLYAASAFGYFDQLSNNITYDTCKVLRRDSSDIAKRANPRIRSLNADGFHSKNALKGPAYLNCETGWNGDDSIAINGTYHLIMGSDGNKLRVVANYHNLHFDEGDRVEIYKTNGDVEYAIVKKVLPAGDITNEEWDWFKKLPIYQGFVQYKTFKNAYDVELDHTVDAPRRSMILNTNRIGNGFKIIGGKFGNNRSRGLIIKTGNGVIDGATIEAAWMESIKIAPEWFWFEGGHTENLTIKNCNINCGAGPAISINSPVSKGHKEFSKAGAHRNIKIINNKIRYVSLPVIFATSVADLKIKKNDIKQVDEAYYFHMYDSHMGVRCSEPITLINCN